MTETPISREVALRIALAARELPETDPARLMKALGQIIEFPPTEKKLSKLSVKDLKQAGDGEFADVDTAALKSVLGLLKGEGTQPAEPLPETEAYQDGEMPDSVRVACASTKGDMLNGHFGSCKRFLIYQVSADEQRLIDIRDCDDSDAEDKNVYRASLIKDCQLVFIASVGGPAAAKIVRAGVHPIKKPEPQPAAEAITELQKSMTQGVAPWLAKVMGKTPEERMRFEHDEEHGNLSSGTGA